ncbi:DHHA1 domain-containing protein [Candidatus Hydrogenisulfobacillus filiaventi]|uniref:DHHA1 domain-containing protein n=1 Tax=Candidatus Hydrogenisulfobacillus filiaventi TaxID=2707344 RepID=A0A6F8ZH77_9FIRM|nr:DHHA1 domain-containing protein [Bacillota bacterium]CAB1128805.1 DHHA1 domain-containing protein [Candidatus Hydrogenisulfobacillus filiaventi]
MTVTAADLVLPAEPPAHGYLITHDRCLDGATAGVVAEAAGLFPVFVEPDGAPAALEAFRQRGWTGPLYLADVSVPEALFPAWQDAISRILDHHQTALPLSRYPRVTVDLHRSGAHLWYDFCVERGWLAATPEWDRLVQEVERYDLWQPGRGLGQDLNRLLRERGYNWYRTYYAHGWRPLTPELGDQLADLIRHEAEFVRAHLKRAQWWRAGSLTGAAVALEDEGPVNEVAHRLLEAGADVVILLKPDGRLSARSNNRVNVAERMQAGFQGGGHARAAGGQLPEGLSRSVEGAVEVLRRLLRDATGQEPQPALLP